jgi:YfiH family protein
VRTADCVPILLADPSTGAVAAVHAGWRGVVARVTEAAVTALREAGAETSKLIAAIGPHISLAAFEVSEDVAEQLVESSPDRDVVSRDFGAKPHVDMRRIVRAQLRVLGLAQSAIDDVRGCTVCDDDLFSYRRDGKRSGRLLSAIVPCRRVGSTLSLSHESQSPLPPADSTPRSART